MVLNNLNLGPLVDHNLRRWRGWRAAAAIPGRKRPTNLLYDVDDVPPMAVQIAAAFQHLFVISVGCSLTFLPPVILTGLAGGYSLIFLMVLVVGVGGMFFSRLVHRLRAFSSRPELPT